MIIGVDVPEDQESRARAFVEKYKLTFPVGRDTAGKMTSRYVIHATPTVLFVDRAGILTDWHVGELPKASFRQLIEDLLG